MENGNKVDKLKGILRGKMAYREVKITAVNIYVLAQDARQWTEKGGSHFPHSVDCFHKGIVDDEGDGHIKTDTTQAGNSALVKSKESLLLGNLNEAIQSVLVFVCVEALHSRLHHIDGGISC